MIDSTHVVSLIEKADVKGLTGLLDNLKSTPQTAAARGLALGPDLVLRLMAFNMIAYELANGFDPPQGGELAEAVLTVGRAHLNDPACNASMIAENVAFAAGNLALAYADAGRHGDIIALSDEMEALLAGRTDGKRLATLRLFSIDALIGLHRLEEAERALSVLEAAGCTDAKLPSVRDRLASQLRSAAVLANDSPPVDRRAAAEILEYNDAAIELLAGAVGIQDSELFSWQTRVNKASRALVEGSGRDPEQLVPALRTFRAAIDWYDMHNQRERSHYARWRAYLAERGLGHIEAALDVLEELAARLERDRAGIADRLRRAGQRANFPKLPARMVECADMLEDPRRMLAAIEAAKGRALADLRTSADGTAFDEAALRVTPDAIADLVARLGVGYTSYLATDDAVIAVAVWPDGTWHRVRIPMDVAARTTLCSRIQPSTWTVPTRPAVFDFGAALTPLIDWLLNLLPALPTGGHLVLSPDAELHQWPLHMATTPSGPLGLLVGVSRVHGIDALRRLAVTPPTRPRRAIAVYIPARDEGDPTDKVGTMARTVAVLPNPAIIPPERADTAFFAKLDASDAVLHLNAHGIFPETRLTGGIDPNPYRSAGLLLAHEGQLPDRSATWPHRLTPALVIETPSLRLDRATVVVQGCVSGLSKEGQGGDALGVEWSLLARGAETVLASHWDVDYRSAGTFCRRFHEAWLGCGSSRIAAWQEAVARTRQDPDGGPSYDWAAFSLSGDWR